LPRADLRFRNDALDPLALVKVLALMCCPGDPRGREAIMRRHPSHMTVLRHQPRQPAQSEGYAVDLWTDVSEHQRRGFLAGAVCLAMAQISAIGRPGDAAVVLDLAVDLADKCEQAMGLEHAMRAITVLPPPQAGEVFAAFDGYRGASHLWAAAVYGRIQLREDLIPRMLPAIPRFLAYADEIARLACGLRWAPAEPSLALAPAMLWTLVLPDALTRRAEAEIRQPEAMPPPPVQPAADGGADAEA
jgi:hypothetical protein